MTDKEPMKRTSPLMDGTVYSKRKNHQPFSVPTIEQYNALVGEERTQRLLSVAQRLKGLKLLEVNATATGGGVAEMLYSFIPFLNDLGIEAEWKIIKGTPEYYGVTKTMHNQLQGMHGQFTPQMKQIYFNKLEDNLKDNYFDYDPQVVMIHDPQPLGLVHYLKEKEQSWLWRCHIDIGETVMEENPSLWNMVADSLNLYDAAFFSAAQYVKERWPVPKFIIPPFIDPLSEKNRQLEQHEIDEVLAKYKINPSIPLIVQVGRFDPWKGINRTIATFRRVRRQKKCQLVIAGGQASDDPEGIKTLAKIQEETRDDEDIRILNLPLEPRLANHREVNALQRAAKVIMQPSTREGFGLVVTEALWKAKPVIAADVGAISLQIKEGHNGFFYQNPYQAEMKMLRLLSDQELARTVGEHGRQYVMEHFLMPDRVADYLKSIELTLDSNEHRKLPSDIVVSFRSWYKLGRKKRGNA